MVQKQVLTKKLGIQDSDANKNLKKPSSFHHLDGKTRGPDLKKKMMKKSRSLKVPDIEAGLRASPLKKTTAQPGKPPPFNVSSPKKQPLIKTGDGAPNYMKSTTCSEARKESSPVRTRNSTSSNSSSGSGKTSSLKMVRTLMKTPSFKPAKKRSRVVLCSDINAQRATCSSTLKDSKMPSYLKLSNGATESEGTSAMKVCPYSYCSLNGHHHTPVAPLRSFLSGRRRSLKNQRSIKLEALDLQKVKAFSDGIEEAALSPWGREEKDFFVEIYGGKNGDLEETNLVVADFVVREYDKQVSENLSEGSPRSEIDSDQRSENDAGVSTPGTDSEGECCSSAETDDTIAVGMEWEEDEFCASESEDEAGFLMEIDDELHFYIQNEKILIDREEQEVFEDDDKLSQVSCSLDYDQGSFTEDVLAKTEEEAEAGFIGVMIIPVSTKEQLPEEKVQESEIFEADSKLPGEADQIETIDNLGPEQDEVTEAETLAEEQMTDSCGAEEVDDNVDDEQNNQRAEACQDDSNLEEDSNQDGLGPDTTNEVQERKISSSIDSEEQKDPIMLRSHLAEAFAEAEQMEVEGNDGSDATGVLTAASDSSNQKSRTPISLKGSEKNHELPSICNNRKWTIKSKKQHEESEDERKFNPREPNYLPLVPEPDAEKLDLKHQEMDERRNSEEWMLDYALRQAVNKLAPARKRKVALLVEAFETVTPAPFSHGRPMQACS